MRKPWDRTMKRLLSSTPQDFVVWLLAGAIFNSIVSTELDPERDPIYADLLFDVTLLGKRMLLHIEFQRRRDARMALRLWEYNLKATLQYKCPVWSVRRFEMLYDMLRDTPAFQDIMKEGLERGREEGLEQGREEGLEQGLEQGREALRQTLLAIVQARFPTPRLLHLTKGQAAIIDDPAVLQDLIVKVSLAQSAEEAQRYLLDWPDPDNAKN